MSGVFSFRSRFQGNSPPRRLVYDFRPCLAGAESHSRKIKCKLKKIHALSSLIFHLPQGISWLTRLHGVKRGEQARGGSRAGSRRRLGQPERRKETRPERRRPPPSSLLSQATRLPCQRAPQRAEHTQIRCTRWCNWHHDYGGRLNGSARRRAGSSLREVGQLLWGRGADFLGRVANHTDPSPPEHATGREGWWRPDARMHACTICLSTRGPAAKAAHQNPTQVVPLLVVKIWGDLSFLLFWVVWQLISKILSFYKNSKANVCF